MIAIILGPSVTPIVPEHIMVLIAYLGGLVGGWVLRELYDHRRQS